MKDAARAYAKALNALDEQIALLAQAENKSAEAEAELSLARKEVADAQVRADEAFAALKAALAPPVVQYTNPLEPAFAFGYVQQ